MTKSSTLFLFSALDFRSRRNLSAGMASDSSTSKLACGVFSSCYSRWSRRLPLQSAL